MKGNGFNSPNLSEIKGKIASLPLDRLDQFEDREDFLQIAGLYFLIVRLGLPLGGSVKISRRALGRRAQQKPHKIRAWLGHLAHARLIEIRGKNDAANSPSDDAHQSPNDAPSDQPGDIPDASEITICFYDEKGFDAFLMRPSGEPSDQPSGENEKSPAMGRNKDKPYKESYITPYNPPEIGELEKPPGESDLFGGDERPKARGRKKPAVPKSIDDLDEEAAKGFEIFWRVYPRRVGKVPALRSWAKLDPAERRKAAIAAERFGKEAKKDADRDDWLRFIPHPATWLNGRRFDDYEIEPEPARSAALINLADHRPPSGSAPASSSGEMKRLHGRELIEAINRERPPPHVGKDHLPIDQMIPQGGPFYFCPMACGHFWVEDDLIIACHEPGEYLDANGL